LDGEPVWPNPPNPSGNGTAGGNFVVNFTSDNATLAFTTPLTASNPLGSLVYSSSITSVIATSGDSDSFTLSVDAGQTITIVADPSGSLQSTIAILAPDATTLGTAIAPAGGQNAVVQTVRASATGVYTITIGGAAGSTGLASVQAILNAAVETESNGGATNNSLATAQDLTASFVSLGGGAARAAVLGTGDGGPSQYANTVIAFSSQFSTTSWGAVQALGAPNVTSYGDNSSAWTPSSQNGTSEYITVGYATPVYATGVTIRETWGNGFVTRV